MILSFETKKSENGDSREYVRSFCIYIDISLKLKEMADEDLKVNILVDSGVYEIRRRKKAPKERMKFTKTMKTKSKSCFISYHTSADDFCDFHDCE